MESTNASNNCSNLGKSEAKWIQCLRIPGLRIPLAVFGHVEEDERNCSGLEEFEECQSLFHKGTIEFFG